MMVMVVFAFASDLASAGKRKSKPNHKDLDVSKNALEELQGGADFKKIFLKYVSKDWEAFYQLIMKTLKMSTNSCMNNRPHLRSEESFKTALEEDLKQRFQRILLDYMLKTCKKEVSDVDNPKHQPDTDSETTPGPDPEEEVEPDQ